MLHVFQKQVQKVTKRSKLSEEEQTNKGYNKDG